MKAAAPAATAGKREPVLLAVPLFRQRFMPEAWEKDGFSSSSDAALWSNRSCGIACVRMILAHYGSPVPTMAALLREGLGLGAYSSRGWVHAGLANLLRRHRVDASAQRIDREVEALMVFLREGRPVIASVTERLPMDGRRGGHLVVVTGGVLPGEGAGTVYFNDPSAWGQRNPSVPSERFLSSFTGRIVVPRGGRQRA